MAKITMKIRPRQMPDVDYTQDFIGFMGHSKAMPMPDNWGFLTATNSRLFIGFQILYSSCLLTHNSNMAVIDLGMTPKQLEWCNSRKRLTVIKHKSTLDHNFYWEAWRKPLYVFLDSPFEYTVWLDADMMVINDLTPLIVGAEEKPVFTADYTPRPTDTLNQKMLYKLMPLEGYKEDCFPFLNTGIFAVNVKRDKKLMQDWCYCVMQATRNKDIENSITLWDQGAAKWALQKHNMVDCIVEGKKWNHPASDRHITLPRTPYAIKKIMYDAAIYKNIANVIHWMGSPKPWANWGEMINLDVSF